MLQHGRDASKVAPHVSFCIFLVLERSETVGSVKVTGVSCLDIFLYNNKRFVVSTSVIGRKKIGCEQYDRTDKADN